ncbi:MAG: hypothetical protein IKC39_01925 [Clostridia bacterium]|nr:hypothetical protein [Clostridia bacterium]
MLETKISVKSYDVFPNSTLKPSALQHYMQQLAREDCDEMACTYQMMRDVNMVFVLTKLGINIKKPVYAYDELTVRTYNNKVSGVSFEREFEFYRDGEEIIHATTQWVVVKYDNRQIVRPRDFPFPIGEANIDCDTIELPRLVKCENKELLGERTVRLSDLDENDHLNNCVYSDIALDFLPFDRKEDFVSGVRIIFRHEAVINDKLLVFVGKTEKGFAVFADNSTKESACFEAEYILGKIDC